jgi:colanic acid biosynthesis glycosyl transferase WcaI
MRILVITTFYAPDLGPAAALYAMLCEDLVELGHEVSVIAAVPHYPTGQVAESFRGRLFQREVRNGVRITRVWVPSVDRARLGERLLTFAVYQALACVAGAGQEYDLILAGNPALEVFLPFLSLAVLRRKSAIFSVHDLYPDVGVKLGVFRHRPVIRLVNGIEKFCLKRAKYVRVLSEGFRRSLIERSVPDSKIVMIPDWLDTDFIQPGERHNGFSAQWNLDDCFVVQYAGNIGLSQGLEHVIETAALLAGACQIRFVFVGDGVGRASLAELAKRRGLTNVQFIPFQSYEKLPTVLASADVALVALKKGLSSDSVPSKFYSILASGRPLIAAVDANSDTARLVEEAKCGVRVEPHDSHALADAIQMVYRDLTRSEQFGESGRAYVVKHHGRRAAALAFDRIVHLLRAPNDHR